MVKINVLEFENVKRIKAVSMEPTADGITIIGGKNGQGKTSVLDAIAWALGGDRYKPSEPKREGSYTEPVLKVVLSNGIEVTRSGKNGALKVVDQYKNRAGQQLLNDFIDELALNMPRFLNSSNKEKAETLLRIIGVGDQLHELETEEDRLYQERLTVGRIADQKQKFFDEMEHYPDAPEEYISISDLIREQQEILAKNGENQRKRERYKELLKEKENLEIEIGKAAAVLKSLQLKHEKVSEDCRTAGKSAEDLNDESTEEIEQSIADIEKTNIMVRANIEKQNAGEEARSYRDQYDGLTQKIEQIRRDKKALLDNADLPLEGLSVDKGELTYKGQRWDNMSASEQLKVATAIIRKLNPNCGFVLVDKLEQMDTDTLKEFGEWVQNEGLQIIATRVSTGDECSIIIDDGSVVGRDPEVKKEWKKGEF